jgi:1,4-alpha-glucan branching enzyme
MGQEFLEHRQWADAPEFHAESLSDWDALARDQSKVDFHRFTRELLWLRRMLPALRAEGVAVRLIDDFNRVLAFERWIPGIGRNVVVVASLNESTQSGRPVPFPLPVPWREVFNSDVYESWVNPGVAGNGGRIRADGPPLNGLPASSAIVIPANGLLVFAIGEEH